MLFCIQIGTSDVYLLTKKCTNRICNAVHYPGYAKSQLDGESVRVYNKDALLLEDIFVNTIETLFSMKFMIHTSTITHRCHVSFKVL